ASFAAPTPPQAQGWPAIARGDSTLILAPTGSGKTLAAFLWAINRVMFGDIPVAPDRCRIIYVSPLKALAVDVERNLRAPIAGIGNHAVARGDAFHAPAVAVRTGDTPAIERARFQREPADILITTPESLYLLLTSNARDALRGVDTIIIDEIHALVPTKRGAHLAISIERLEARCHRAPQRIGLSATQRPLDEVARFLGGQIWNFSPTSSSPEDTRPSNSNSRRARHLERTLGGRNSRSDPHAEIADEFAAHGGAIRYRPVTIVAAGATKALALTIEVPVEDMAKLTTADDVPSGPASVGD